jgi:ABC-type branched-subunit amino acid transport system ATPase component
MDLVFNFAERISVLVAGKLLTEGAPEPTASCRRSQFSELNQATAKLAVRAQ